MENSRKKLWKLFENCFLKIVFLTLFLVHISTSSTYTDDVSADKDRILANMQSQVSGLETSVSKVNTEVGYIESQENEMKKSLVEQKETLNKLESGLESLDKSLSKNLNNMFDVLDMTFVHRKEKYFELSNDTCGGVIVAREGFISFSIYPTSLPLMCLWTMQANHQSIFKFQAHTIDLLANSSSSLMLVGLISGNDSNSVPTRAKVTRLSSHMTYTFKGPLAYLVLWIPSTSGPAADPFFYTKKVHFQAQFEGIGARRHYEVRYDHQQMHNKTGNLTGFHVRLRNYISPTFKLHYNTVSFNFSTFTRYKLNFSENWWCDEGSIFMINDILKNSDKEFELIDYCKKREEGPFILINVEEPLIVITLQPLQERDRRALHTNDISYYHFLLRSTFRLTWLSDENYPSFERAFVYNPLSPKCGGVLSGNNGFITYRQAANTVGGTRCVWTVVRKNRGDVKSFLNFYLRSHFSYISSSSFYLMELTDEAGNLLQTTNRTFFVNNEARTRSYEVFLIYETSVSYLHGGFTLEWRDTDKGNYSADLDTYSTFKYVTEVEGSLKIEDPARNFPSVRSNQFIIFTPHFQAVKFDEMTELVIGINVDKYELSAHHKSHLHAHGALEQLPYYAPQFANGLLERVHEFRVLYTFSDGILLTNITDADRLVILAIPKETKLPLELEFKWKKEKLVNQEKEESAEERCGGVISGSKGIIEYKPDKSVNERERCIWLLQTPNSSRIDLKLRQSMFNSQQLFVSSIDPEVGMLKNEAVKLSWRNRVQTFGESVLVILFVPSGRGLAAASGGFILQFEGKDYILEGNRNESNSVHFNLQHSNSNISLVSQWQPKDISFAKEIRVYAFSSTNYGYGNLTVHPSLLECKSGFFKWNLEITSEICAKDAFNLYIGWGLENSPRLWLHHISTNVSSCPSEKMIDNGKLEDVNSEIHLIQTAYLAIMKYDPAGQFNGKRRYVECKYVNERSAEISQSIEYYDESID